MRKKLLTITTSVLVTLSLASCNESSSIPTSKPTSDNPTSETPTSEVVAPAVPTEEGKVTFYFTKDEANSVAFASYESVYGLIESVWTLEQGKLTWQVTIPGNTTATLKVPKAFQLSTLGQVGINGEEEIDTEQIIEIGSGKYLFQSK